MNGSKFFDNKIWSKIDEREEKVEKKDRKNKGSVSLILVPALLILSGCAGDQTQRDVYTRFEDCVADWGKPELCQQIAEAEAKQLTESQGVMHTASGPIVFWGPPYYHGDRAVSYGGQTYIPGTNRAMSKPFMVHSGSSSAAKSSLSSPRIVSRGGFGGFARSVGG